MSKPTITALIVEDEYPARLRLQQLLHPYDWLELLPDVDTGAKAVQAIDELLPQVVFMDIHLPDFSGLQVLQTVTHNPYVIFTTAYEAYALQAFDSLSIDYLLKPLTQEQIDRAMNKLLLLSADQLLQSSNLDEVLTLLADRRTVSNRKQLPVTKGHSMIFVPYEDIAYIKAENKYSVIYTIEGRQHLSDKSLSELEELLRPQFIRIHRSHMINISKINKVGRSLKGTYVLTLDDEHSTQLRTSQTYTPAFKQQMNL